MRLQNIPRDLSRLIRREIQRRLRPIPAPHQVFGSLDDAAWLATLTASIKEPVQNGVTLPGFPDPEIQTHTVGSAYDATLREASRFHAFVYAACQQHGRPIGAATQILDFGVSWGRIIRFFLRDTDAAHLHGVDVNERYLNAARETGCLAQLQQIDPMGSLPYADASFDLVYAYSVFTHLPEPMQDRWLGEIRRVLKPGAMFIATVQPPRFLAHLRAVDPNDESNHPWTRSLAAHIAANPGIQDKLDRDGVVYIQGGATYGDIVMTPGYVHRHWGEMFEVLDYLDDVRRFTQAVVTTRRPCPLKR